MTGLLTQIELTQEQYQQHIAGEMVRIPADFDEFLDFLETTRYRTDYLNNHIIIMPLARFIHEWLVSQLTTLFSKKFTVRNGYYVASSNLGIHVPDQPSYVNADLTVIKGKPQFFRNSEAVIENPYIVVEVLSNSTKRYDLTEKLEAYQQIESLVQVVFVDIFNKTIKTINRTDTHNAWLHSTYNAPEDVIKLIDYELKLSAVFEDMPEL
jgi:Uma2 family endonuclease